MSIIVLKELLRTYIKDFDLFICAARGQTRAIWVILNISYHARVIIESMNWFLAMSAMLHIPQHNSFIVRARCNHSGV